ncbi:MAG: hypothetical protein ACLFSQ_02785 [Candidatus Zixiibacteriota bacterium]
MAIFQIDNGKAKRIRLSEFRLEKDLQTLIEQNLETIFNCRFVATEYSTGNLHSGRIDTYTATIKKNQKKQSFETNQ